MGNLEKPGHQWRDFRVPRAGKVWVTTEKVVAMWEDVVEAQTFLTLSSSVCP